MDASDPSNVADHTESRWAIGISGDLAATRARSSSGRGPRKKRPMMSAVLANIEVYWIKTPVILWGRSRMDKLRGFVQRAVMAMGEPAGRRRRRAAAPPVAGRGTRLEGLRGGRHPVVRLRRSVAPQDGVAIMGTAKGPPTLKEETHRLLCYWPAADVLLPALPQSLRHRDLALLPDHELKGEFLDAYERIRSWKDQDAIHRGKLESLELPPPPPPSRPRAPSPSVTRPDGTVIGSETTRPLPPHRPDSVHVKRSRLDLICLTWAQLERESGVWNVESRFWSRLRGTEYDDESTSSRAETRSEDSPCCDDHRTRYAFRQRISQPAEGPLGTIFSRGLEGTAPHRSPFRDPFGVRRGQTRRREPAGVPRPGPPGGKMESPGHDSGGPSEDRVP